MPSAPITFQDLILRLTRFWRTRGCLIRQPYDLEMGAGTFHAATFLGAIGPEPWSVAYVQASRRPGDGRYGDNPNRLQHYFQYQVFLKPSPKDIQQRYLDSLVCLDIDPKKHDIRFVEDNWESPSLGAWGLGWEVWLDGMEISQFTYFQQVGGLECRPVSGELTYGLERIALCLQNTDNVYRLVFDEMDGRPIYYGDLYQQNEREMSIYNFEQANVTLLRQQFSELKAEGSRLIEEKLPIPAYELLVKASHCFNVLDARGAIAVTERQAYILGLQRLAKAVAAAYQAQREALGFPLLPDTRPDDNS